MNIQANIQNLERQQDILLQEFNSLRSDAGSITIHARSLNLYYPQDKVIQFRGFRTSNLLPGPGQMLIPQEPAPYNEQPLRIIALALGGLCLLFLVIRRGFHACPAK